jgi:glycosyltransferase involved in cell wall biosynthesis
VKVGYVVQRYGADIVGGAEAACRAFATRLAAAGDEVTVLTTTAIDSSTWADVLPAGESADAGVRVVRYPAVAERAPGFDRQSRRLFTTADTEPALEERWIRDQGPLVPGLLEALRHPAAEPDLWVFYTYLYYPTLAGLPLVAGRAVLHPALHDEPQARLRSVQRVLRSAAGLSLHSPEEWELVLRLAGWPPARLSLTGLGVDEGEGDPEAFRGARGLEDAPYLLYLGRVDDGKGTAGLARMFARYKARHPGPLKLVIAGPVVQPPPAHGDIVVPGALTDAERWGALAGAEAFVHPSPAESFAIVLLEAWTKGRPALVNAACPVTAGHARRAGGGLAYRDYADFEAALELLHGDPAAAATLGRNGARYAAGFRWEAVIARYRAFLARVAEAADRPSS